jgi:hypothetical protein
LLRKHVLFFVVILEFFLFFFAPLFLFFHLFHGLSRELFIFCAPFVFFTLAQQASYVFGRVFRLWRFIFAPLLRFSRLHSKRFWVLAVVL